VGTLLAFVMGFKIRRSYRASANQVGFTLVELLVAFIITAILTGGFIYYSTNILNSPSRARDQVRLKDITLLEQAINEYSLDNSIYPGDVDTTYVSNLLPISQAGPLIDTVSGWIEADFSPYMNVLYVDPTNTNLNVYTYRHNGSSYEVNAVLEELDNGATDGGNMVNIYEVGTNLSIL
jgi:type II secretory pathway pseudopilin PulG